MFEIFNIEHTLFEIFDYKISYIEFIGIVFGLLTVWYAAKNNILTWPTAIINVICFFILFWQVQLYSDVFLQIYFFVTSIYGWIFWNKQKIVLEKISIMSNSLRIRLSLWVVLITLAMGFLVSKIHIFWPTLFIKPASYAYIDTFIAVLSVFANVLLARRILESWVLWVIVDVIATVLYFNKGIKFIALEYFVFLIIAIFGHFNWLKLYKLEKGTNPR